VLYAAENSSVFRCALKVVMVADLLVTGDREFQTDCAVIIIIIIIMEIYSAPLYS